jgi:putative DNA primase/helicase
MTKPAKHVPAALEARAREIVKAFGGYWSRSQGMCCCPAHEDRTPSLSIGLSSGAILFHCFAGCSSDEVIAGFKRHGIQPRDLFDGSGGPIKPVRAISDGPDANALRLWREAKPISDSLADSYLTKRMIDLRSSEMRFHARTPLGRKPDVRYLPALITAVRTDHGIIAVQRTFLDPCTEGKAKFFKPKRALGRLGTGAARLFPPIDGRLGLAEGSESAMSAQSLSGIPCWATLGNERFGIVTIPDSVTELHLFIDADKGGELALRRAREAYARLGRTILSHCPGQPGNDWNDELRNAQA